LTSLISPISRGVQLPSERSCSGSAKIRYDETPARPDQTTRSEKPMSTLSVFDDSTPQVEQSDLASAAVSMDGVRTRRVCGRRL